MRDEMASWRGCLLCVLCVLVVVRAQLEDEAGVRRADPADCRRFFAADQPQQCPSQQLFDAASLSCVAADQATCAPPDAGASDVPALPVRIRKCCAEDQQFSLTEGSCVDRDGPWEPPLYVSDPLQPDRPEPVVGPVNFTTVAQKLECETLVLNADPAYPDAIFLLDSGMLYVQSYRLIYTTSVYCIETFTQSADAEAAVRLGAAVCADAAEPDVIPAQDDRVQIPRCCARGVRYDPETARCVVEDTADIQYEVPPPLDFSRDDIRAVVAQGDLTTYFKFSLGFPECGDLKPMGVGDHPIYVGLDSVLYVDSANITLAPGGYCVNEASVNSTNQSLDAFTPMAIVCADEEVQEALLSTPTPPSCDDGTDKCVRKCCAPGYEVNLAESEDASLAMTCVYTEKIMDVSASPAVAEELHNISTIVHRPSCLGGLFEVKEGNFSLLADGAFRLVEYDEYACNFQTTFDAPASAYCLDTVRGSSRPVHAFYCYPTVEEDDTSATYIFFPILMGITDFFLLVTFIVYLTVPDPTQTGLNKKRKLSQSVLGMILLAYISSLFFAYLVLMIVQTATSFLSENRTVCKVLAVILYFFLLSAFFWLSVICFEIYLSTRADKRTSGRKRFRLYAAYAWGCPLLMASLALVMDLAPGIDNCTFIKPAFGRYRCLFQNRAAFVAYFYIPIGVLLAACVLLYILTVKNLSVPSKMPGRGDSDTMSKQSAKQQSKRRRLCAKLFLIMGITWVAELLSYLIGGSVVWYFFDVINILQGFFIFVAFILRPKVLQYIKKTALQSLSRSFGHDSQQEPGGAGAGAHNPHPGGITTAAMARAGGPHPSSPHTNSTRVTGGSTRTSTPGAQRTSAL